MSKVIVDVDEDIPELTFELARQLGEFPEFAFTVEAADIHDYCKITGDSNALYDEFIPPAFAAIFGRLAYLRDHRTPPGAVLLGQTIAWLRAAKRDEDLVVKARVVSAEQKNGRRKLVFETTARQGEGVVAVVRIVAGWPK
jgi:hypothetical protein